MVSAEVAFQRQIIKRRFDFVKIGLGFDQVMSLYTHIYVNHNSSPNQQHTCHQDALWEEDERHCDALRNLVSYSTIHMDVTLTRATYLSTVTDQVRLFMETLFPGGSGLFQQEKAPYHRAKRGSGMI